jgi:twitching motility protein PilT
MSITLGELVEIAQEERASDLHLREGHCPRARVDGELFDLNNLRPLGAREIRLLLDDMMTADQKRRFEEAREVDFSCQIGTMCRLRVNLFHARDAVNAAIRLIPRAIPTMEEIYLPPACWDFVEHPHGLVLVTGPTGSGKSTTLAAMIDHINEHRRAHILTIEDPIEFLYEERLATISQREIGTDSLNFADALKHCFRQDPDVVLIGEMRDIETMRIAITLAETGHLAFSTLHTNEAAGTINRVIDSFPPHQQAQVRMQLAASLLGIIAQRLLPRSSGEGRVAAREVLVCTRAVRNLIREGKIHQIASAMQTGGDEGMMPMNASLGSLLREGLISFEVALSASNDRKEFKTKYGEFAEQAG